MNGMMQSLTLTEEEIVEATGYRQHRRQLEVLRRAGIPADQRPDGSVRVWRHHLAGTAPKPERPKPRPQLASDRKVA